MIATCIHTSARAAPDAVAVLFGEQQVTYARAAAEIDHIAAGLFQAGLAPGKVLGIRINHPYWHWLVLLAGMRLGARILSLSANAAQEQEAVGGTDLLVTDGPNVGLAAPGAGRLTLTEPWIAGTLAADTSGLPDPAVAEAAFARYTFSSGTTGRPKCALLDRRHLGPRVALNRVLFGIGRTTRLRTGLGIETVSGFLIPIVTWLSGGAVVIFRSPETASDDFRRHRPTTLMMSPHGLQQALAVMPGDTAADGLSVVVVGGILPVALRDRTAASLGCRLQVLYGSTETGSVASCDAVELNRHPGAVGFVSPGGEVEVVDALGVPVPAGEEGEIRARSQGMIDSYIGQDGGDSRVFREGWFYPGDRGLFHADGLLAVTGRSVEVLNIGGVKLAPGDIETVVLAVAGVRDACALALPGDGDVDGLAVALCLDPGLEIADVRRQLRAAMPKLGAFRLIGVETIPRNAMGKVPRLPFAAALARRLRENAG